MRQNKQNQVHYVSDSDDNPQKCCQSSTKNHIPKTKILQKRPKIAMFSHIVKNIKHVPMYLKKGTNTQKHHIHLLSEKMINYRKYYLWKKSQTQTIDFFDKAETEVKKLRTLKAGNYTLDHLDHIFGGSIDKDKEQFIINRMNAQHMEEYIFGPKIEDKMTTMLFFHEYRSRLFNPLLCRGLQCQRPLIRKD